MEARMETYSLLAHAGLYSVVATAPDGRDRLVATCPTEANATEIIRKLQAAGLGVGDANRVPDERFTG
jgi:hypothetical protein